MRPYVYLVLSCVLLLFCLLVDAAYATMRRQALLGLCMLAFLIIASRFSSPEERRKIWVLVVLATLVELDCSILWGIYDYRLGNMPLYVPPAHGIIFLFGLRWARTPLALAHPRALQRLTLAGAVIWAGAGLTLSPGLAHRPDVLGALCLPVLAWFVTRPSGSIYSGVFLVTSLLELVGTGLGDWTWVATAPVVHIPVGNPPAAIAAGYCVMDYASSLIVGLLPAVEKGVRRFLRARTNTILRRAGNNKRRNPSLRRSHGDTFDVRTRWLPVDHAQPLDNSMLIELQRRTLEGNSNHRLPPGDELLNLKALSARSRGDSAVPTRSASLSNADAGAGCMHGSVRRTKPRGHGHGFDEATSKASRRGLQESIISHRNLIFSSHSQT